MTNKDHKVFITKICQISTVSDNHSFVGIQVDEDNIPKVYFPIGFSLHQGNEKEMRRDILLLIKILEKMEKKYLGYNDLNTAHQSNLMFPISSYLFLIQDYINRGLYKEKTNKHKITDSGKIDYPYTIKRQKPCFQNHQPYYLEFFRRKKSKKDDLISKIHHFLIYESFIKIGWLFAQNYEISRPTIKYNFLIFKHEITSKLLSVFVDQDRRLFYHMLSIIEYMSSKQKIQQHLYGTNNFEYVWESMVDYVFGIKNKQSFFPKTYWHINNFKKNNSCLEPDTVMMYQDSIYILDSKYYKYGITSDIRDLPNTSSIAKQIIYGEYAHYLTGQKVFNVFLLPFNANIDNNKQILKKIGKATCDWKDGQKKYHDIHCVLLDTKHLMISTIEKKHNMIKLLASIVSEEIEKYS